VSAYLCGRSSVCHRLTAQKVSAVTQTQRAFGQATNTFTAWNWLCARSYSCDWPTILAFELKRVKGNSRARFSTCFPCERAQQKRSVT
jgi:hypothetical protein